MGLPARKQDAQRTAEGKRVGQGRQSCHRPAQGVRAGQGIHRRRRHQPADVRLRLLRGPFQNTSRRGLAHVVLGYETSLSRPTVGAVCIAGTGLLRAGWRRSPFFQLRHHQPVPVRSENKPSILECRTLGHRGRAGHLGILQRVVLRIYARSHPLLFQRPTSQGDQLRGISP